MNGTADLIKLPLYDFFIKLQTYDQQLDRQVLSFDVYLQLVEALCAGHGLLNRTSLYGLCKRVWLKPYHDESKFKALFDAHLKEESNKSGADEETQTDKENSIIKDDNDILPKEDEDLEEQDMLTDEDDLIDEISEESTAQSTQQTSVSVKFTSSTAQKNEFIKTDLKKIEESIYGKIFRLHGRYTTISPRKVEQGLRSLRIQHEVYARKYIDLPNTIEQVATKGFFVEPVYSYGIEDFSEITLLVDSGGSMIAFYFLEHLLQEKVQLVNNKESVIFYFRNCPVNQLFYNKEQTKGIPIVEFKQKKRHPIIIFSDAGAARGGYEKERIRATQQFLGQLDNYPIIWINPVPKKRWLNTSAQYIAAYTNMYEATDLSFINAIKKLKWLQK